MTQTCQIHGSAVALDNRALVILGAAGSGKSTLALEMVALGASLVSDDRIDLLRKDDALLASAPENIAGLIEARGIGLIRMPHQSGVPVAWVVDLDKIETERLPTSRTTHLLDVPCPVILGKGRAGLAAILCNLVRFGRCEIDYR
ncbi:MAG: HPr kinase/phosphatase C-terminal domain-containing protein [Pseudomonadota bacterium]